MGMGGGGGGNSRQMAIQNQQSMAMQREVLDLQKAQAARTEQQRKRVMREETTSAAEEAQMRSTYRRRGMLNQDSLVTAQGYGGYEGRDMSGGVARQYSAPAVPAPPAGGNGTSGADRLSAGDRMRQIFGGGETLFEQRIGRDQRGGSNLYQSTARQDARRLSYQRARNKGYNIPSSLINR